MVILKAIASAVIGYLLGSISPSYIISKKKKVDLRKCGTGNLGASNTFVNLGKKYGILVMAFDIFKAWLAVNLSAALFPGVAIARVASGSAAVIGHNHPFYLKFKGGKGIAAFGGFVLAYSVHQFLFLLALCLLIAVIINYSCMLSYSAAILFPFVATFSVWQEGGDISLIIATFVIISISSISIIIKHTGNLKKIKEGKEVKFSAFMKKYIFPSK
jgi:glycerol-3-phosphate acyltransferase PlsY